MIANTTRQFRKHTVLGDIYAVEFNEADVLAASLCTRPEEMTRGALPVLALNATDAQFVQTNASEFVRWEPPMADEEKLAAIIDAEGACQVAQYAAEQAQKAHRAAQKQFEKACDDLRRVVREASAPPLAPLLALAEQEPTGTPFNFDPGMENFSDDHGTDDRDDRSPEPDDSDPD